MSLGVLFYWGFQTIERSQGNTSGASQGSAADAAQGSAGEAVWEPGEAVIESDAPVTEEYEYRGLELERHTYPGYRFTVDVPARPYELKAGDLGEWDFGVRVVVDVPGVRDDAVFEVLVAASPGIAGSAEVVDGYLAEIETQYTGGDELRSVTSGRINGQPCAITRSRYAGSESPEPVVTTAFWVPGEGYEYVVRCIAFEDDWARARRPMTAIASTFRYW